MTNIRYLTAYSIVSILNAMNSDRNDGKESSETSKRDLQGKEDIVNQIIRARISNNQAYHLAMLNGSISKGCGLIFLRKQPLVKLRSSVFSHHSFSIVCI